MGLILFAVFLANCRASLVACFTLNGTDGNTLAEITLYANQHQLCNRYAEYFMCCRTNTSPPDIDEYEPGGS